MLQWGHDFSAVEIPPHDLRMRGNAAGFNGATTFQPWKSMSGCNRCGRCCASMGPRLFSRGNCLHGCPCPSCKNTLQWGHDFSAVEILVHRERPDQSKLCFNGATTFQPWKCLESRRVGACHHRFNGATTFQPWKCSA